MKKAGPRLNAIVDGLMDWGIENLVYVPSSHAAPVIRGLEARGVPSLMANREEEAVGIAGGLALAGRKVAILMQDNGFGNAMTALATFAVQYHIPIPIFANSRGGLGEYNAMIHSISEAAPKMLNSIGVRVERLTVSDRVDVWRANTSAAAKISVMQHRPIVTLFDALHPLIEPAE
ncbi:MAG TPA: thiamine pyrophosphate-binding protein [Candidatus Nanopelagicaceae bacterium]